MFSHPCSTVDVSLRFLSFERFSPLTTVWAFSTLTTFLRFRTRSSFWTSPAAFCRLNVFPRLLVFGHFPRSLLFYVFALVLHSGRLLPLSVVWTFFRVCYCLEICHANYFSTFSHSCFILDVSSRFLSFERFSALASVWTFSTLTTFLSFGTRASFWTSSATFWRLNVFRVC